MTNEELIETIDELEERLAALREDLVIIERFEDVLFGRLAILVVIPIDDSQIVNDLARYHVRGDGSDHFVFSFAFG